MQTTRKKMPIFCLLQLLSFPPHSVSRGHFSVEWPITWTILIQAQKVQLFKVANYIGSVHVDISITDLAVEQSSLVKVSIILHVELVLSFHVSFHTGHPHCSQLEWGPKFFKIRTKWGPDFEWNGDQMGTFGSRNGDLKSVYSINWPKRANSLKWRDFLKKYSQSVSSFSVQWF